MKNAIDIVLVHGGPGARGSLNDLALLLSKEFGVLELNQSKYSISELVEEMDEYLAASCGKKAILLGHSWGAWLICLYAHRYPQLVKKLVLVGSGGFEMTYVREFHERRLSRLSPEEKIYYDKLMEEFMSDDLTGKNKVMADFGELMERLDTFEREKGVNPTGLEADFTMFDKIWSEAAALRQSGRLMEIMKEIDLPIHIIQGDYDSHGIKAIREPFETHGIKYTYHVIEKCGHYPWREKYGKQEFLDIISGQIQSPD